MRSELTAETAEHAENLMSLRARRFALKVPAIRYDIAVDDQRVPESFVRRVRGTLADERVNGGVIDPGARKCAVSVEDRERGGMEILEL